MFKRRHPFCADPFGEHQGRPTPGDHVDHIIQRSAGGADAWSNLQTLCARCHSRKTVMQDGGFGRPRALGGDEKLQVSRCGPRTRQTHARIGFDMGGWRR